MEPVLRDSTILKRIDLLANVGIFSETVPDVLEEIANVLNEIKIRKGHKIFEKGDIGDALYIIQSGKFKVHDGNHVISRMSTGQVFGEFALFDREVRSASVTAEEPSVLLELSLDDFYNVMNKKTEVIRGVLRKVIRRIREMNELESKLAKSYLKIQKQKNEIEEQHKNILTQKQELERANLELRSLNDEKNNLISVVSHGLRNPLTSSMCVLDLLEEEGINCSGQQQEYIRLISKSLRRMNSLINQTLDIDIIQLQRTNLKSDKINLANILEDLTENFKYTLSIKSLNMIFDAEDVFIKGDKNFLFLVFENIISNAIKFSPVEKNIHVSLRDQEGHAKVTIRDEGPGISYHALQTLFDKPQVHGRSSDKSGLFIARKYVEAMQGEILCDSHEGSGTTFTVTFKTVS